MSASTLPRRVFVTTVPFGAVDPLPLRRLAESGIEVVINPLGRRLKSNEIPELVRDFPLIIAGTEIYTPETVAACPNLRAICRVGIGLDGVPLRDCQTRGIAVSYTPDGPSPAVAELAVGLLIDLLRGVVPAHEGLRQSNWNRITGKRIGASTIGIVGVGRIGRMVAEHLKNGFPGARLLCCDPRRDPTLQGVTWVDMDTLMRECDAISFHVPLTAETRGMIGAAEIARMKPETVMVNTARGGVIAEAALAEALASGAIRGAAIDVFEEEPYSGPLAHAPNVILTCHMGSMTNDCRARMEIEATEEAIRFLNGQPFATPVPASEYLL